MEFELVEYKDGTWHLIFEDLLHGEDMDVQINPDGTFTMYDYDDANMVDRYTSIPNLYDFLLAAYKSRMDAIDKYHQERDGR